MFSSYCLPHGFCSAAAGFNSGEYGSSWNNDTGNKRSCKSGKTMIFCRGIYVQKVRERCKEKQLIGVRHHLRFHFSIIVFLPEEKISRPPLRTDTEKVSCSFSLPWPRNRFLVNITHPLLTFFLHSGLQRNFYHFFQIQNQASGLRVY